jgi:hypothetical protein
MPMDAPIAWRANTMLNTASLIHAEALVDRLDSLREPYRGNAIAWIERCAARRFTDLDQDLGQFLDELNPDLRDEYLLNMNMILDDAVKYFGIED